jgi:putative DNA primase/helicase
MTFEQFAIAHGLMIKSVIFDKWVRVPTDDHPKKLNGAYIFDGHTGALINFALHDKHIIYKSKDPYVHDPNAVAKRQQLHKERLERQEKAKRKADYIVSQTTQSTHPYMIRKGFKRKFSVWKDLLVVPMRVGELLVGCQLISPDGTKRFLSGQITKGASLMIEKMAGRDIVCEGLATAMSVRRAMHHLCVPYRIHICFSANNMVEIASCLANPLVIADHDDTGIRCAKKIASTYWLGEAGEDFNDAEQRQGTAAVADSLRPFLYSTSPTL